MPEVVVVGGGFAGAWTARALGRRATVTLVSEHNYLLFTPMLAEVAAADVDPRHILAPLRHLCPQARIVVGTVVQVDPDHRTVVVRSPVDGVESTLGGDALVLAAGSAPATFGIPGVAEHTIGFRTIADALTIRHRLLMLLESTGRGVRGDETTVAVIGAGASGAEVATALADLLHRARRRYYPAAPEPKVTLVDMSDRVLPQLPPGASRRAARAMRRLDLRLGVPVAAVEPGAVVLTDGERIAARTIVWAAGIRARPVPGVDTARGAGDRLVVDERLRVTDGVWALGDAALVPDGHGGISPPTAQHAVRQGAYLGRHLPTMLAGGDTPPFRYRTMGELVSLGHRRAVGRVLGVTVSGFVGWFLWRSYYLLRLPGLLRRLRVAFDWTLDLVFPPDIADPATVDPGPDL